MLQSRALLLPALLTVLTALLAPASIFAQEQTYVVRPGDSLFRIAMMHGVDINTLAQANNITNTWRIYAGQTLIIPSAPSETGAAASQPEALLVPQTHIVQRGETLATIARQYGLTVDQLAQLNGLYNPNLIYHGQTLIVGSSAPAQDASAAPASAEIAEPNTLLAAPVVEDVLGSAAAEPVVYIVQPGEYLSQIASRFGVPWTSIARANNIYDPNTVFAGQRLIIPGAAAQTGSYQASATYGLDYAFAAPPAPTGIGREILVDLSDSRVYAYENGQLVRSVLVSTGLPATPTVQGDFTVQRKYVSQLMAGPGYYLPDVPYILYFYQGYALHGTYWHANWGQPMSHGCVNMPTPEAEWLYYWADIGTPVRVQA
ncbi:MAG: LysM peptidoglycan-binding domain-containing protein [Anaerolinea sp.]|nr:LysM peptidoglycan-binding domain-containing protein [Anaerolinea sp.]